MTGLRVGLTQLRKQRLNHNFQNWIIPLWSCGMDIKLSSHFFLHYPLFDDKWIILLSTLSKTDCKLIETNESSLTETLLFGNLLFDLKKLPHPYTDERIFFNRMNTFWKFIVWFEKITPLSLTHPLITFYLPKDSKNPYFNMFG